LHKKIVQNLCLAVAPIDEFVVRVTNGGRLIYKEYDNVSITIQGFDFSTTLFCLLLHGLDVVLGI